MALKKELEIYESKKNELIAQGHAGKFIVIKEDEVFDIFLAYEDALRQGLKKYGNVPFLVKQIKPIEEVNFFFHGVKDPCQSRA